MISENESSPWHDGILYVQGSALMNEEGERIADVALCEITDQEGDLCWFVFRNTEEGFQLEIKAGTGKWDNIAGSAKMRARDPCRWIFEISMGNVLGNQGTRLTMKIPSIKMI